MLLMHANSVRTSRKPMLATSSRWRASRTPPRVTRCARRTPRSSSSGWNSRPVIELSVEPKTKADQERWASRSIVSLARTPRSA
jgi:hypothetical protein